MSLSPKLVMRQGQSLVMTPQLLQAIKLLQFSAQELAQFVDEELERNPLLERAELPAESAPEHEIAPLVPERREAGDWSRDELAVSQTSVEQDFCTDLSNAFDRDPGEMRTPQDFGLAQGGWSGLSGGGGAETPDLEAYVAAQESLHDHLNAQIMVQDPALRMIMALIIDDIDENGYWRDSVSALAARLSAPEAQVMQALSYVQSLDPTGIGARNLTECLRLQLQERNRLDPAMAKLLEHLDLLAKKNFVALRKLCGVDQDDLNDMIREIRQLEPRPGRGFDHAPVQLAVADVFVFAAKDGTWQVELNPEALPRVLVNQSYYARIARNQPTGADKVFISQCLQTASWLTKSLEQRARTILKVASEIVRQQDGFFALGVEHLRPLNLKTIADAIGMHESTVSRVTSNKFISCARGLFEMKYFFTASIGANSGDSHSAEAVRFKIKQLIDSETPQNVLSDDMLVKKLKLMNIDIARRTVAKYRESLHIASSAERRREKMAKSGI